jgi:hypothetical protein
MTSVPTRIALDKEECAAFDHERTAAESANRPSEQAPEASSGPDASEREAGSAW